MQAIICLFYVVLLYALCMWDCYCFLTAPTQIQNPKIKKGEGGGHYMFY